MKTSRFLNRRAFPTISAMLLGIGLFTLMAPDGVQAGSTSTFNVSATFADNASTRLTGTVTINTATGAVDGFNFDIPTMTVGATVMPGLNLTPLTANGSFFNESGPCSPSVGGELGFSIDGSSPGTEELELVIPQTTLVGYRGGTILNSIPCSSFSSGKLFTGFADFTSSSGGFVKIFGTGTINVVPEPSSLLLLASSLLVLFRVELKKTIA